LTAATVIETEVEGGLCAAAPRVSAVGYCYGQGVTPDSHVRRGCKGHVFPGDKRR
jgi:hypothetical protein